MNVGNTLNLTSFVMKKLIIGVFLMLLGSVQAAPIYRCVDEKGKVYFSDSPPEDCGYTVLSETSAPTVEQRRDAQRIAAETKRLADVVAGTADESGSTRNLSLPDTISSKYLLGKGSGWLTDTEKLEVTANISLKVSEEVRVDGVYVEAQFPNPGSGSDFYDGAQAQRGDTLLLVGKPSVHYECATLYVIHVRVYPTRRKLRVIDRLTQPSVIAPQICQLVEAAAGSTES